MDRGFGDDGAVTDLPWASVFSPTANARALSAIQAEGFHAARQLVDRFVRFIDERGSGSGTGSHPPGGVRADGTPEYEGILQAWWSMFGQLMLGSRGAGVAGPTSAAALDFDTAQANGAVRIDAGAGGSAATTIWLHNQSEMDLGAVLLRCTDLVSHDGVTLGSAAVQFEPAVVPMPAQCSRGVTIRVNLPPAAHPGVYRGTLLVQRHPDIWLPVAVHLSDRAA